MESRSGMVFRSNWAFLEWPVCGFREYGGSKEKLIEVSPPPEFCQLKSNWANFLPRSVNLNAEKTMGYEFVYGLIFS